MLVVRGRARAVRVALDDVTPGEERAPSRLACREARNPRALTPPLSLRAKCCKDPDDADEGFLVVGRSERGADDDNYLGL